MTIRIDAPLRDRVEALARVERRSLADQAAWLMERGLERLERESAPAEKRGLCE